MTDMFLMIGTTEMLLIVGVVLLMFGGKKLPEMMRGLGQGVKSFKEGMREPSGDRQEQGAAETEKQSADEAEAESAKKENAAACDKKHEADVHQ